MDDEDLGVVVSVTSLVMAMAQDQLDAFSTCYQKAVTRLQKVSVYDILIRLVLITTSS
jgi:AP-2 complex subunit alpha